jgi:hypothetical protein
MADFSLVAESIRSLQMNIRAWWNRLCSTERQSTTSPSFGDYYHDILLLISGEIFFDDRLDLLSLCLVNKRCYLACVPWINRDFMIHKNDIQSVTLLRHLLGRANMARFVRRLTILLHGRMHRENYSLPAEAAAKLTGLQKVRTAADGKLVFDFLEKVDLPYSRINLLGGSLLGGTLNPRILRQNLLTCSFAGQLTWLEILIKRTNLH